MITLSRWSIRKKLMVGLAASAAVMIGIGLIGEASERSINAQTLSIYQDDLLPILDIAQVRQALHADADALQGMLLAKSPASIVAADAALRDHAAASDTAWAHYLLTISDAGERAQANALADSRARLRAMNGRALDNARRGQFASELSVASPAYREVLKAANVQVDDLYARNKAQAQDEYQRSQATYRRSLTATALAIAVGLAVALTLLITLLRAIAAPLKRAVTLAADIASGELNHEVTITSHDEIGVLMEALGRMDSQLTAIVSNVRSSAQAVSAASVQLALGTDDLSARTQAQAMSLEETATAMEEMTGSVHHTAGNAEHAASVATKAYEFVRAGQDVTTQAVAAMQAIDASRQRIGEITEMIDSIAFQTNVLALNAAVEAARAGESGRGFAVVAGEVRQLAQRSGSSAKAIRGLIDEASESIAQGTALVESSADALQGILDQIRTMTTVAREIASASAEQALSIGQVNSAMTTLDASTQHTAALVEESAAASRSLQEQAAVLVSEVGFFRIRGDAEIVD